VEFRRKAPHLMVTAPLESLNSTSEEAGLFVVLQELAICTSAREG